MKAICNILWIIFGGWVSAASWFLAGIVMFISVIGIPLGFACFRLGAYALWPLGKELVDARSVGESRILGTGCLNVVWFFCLGLWLAIEHVLIGITYCLTIIGIPFGIISFKIAGASLCPLGKRIVSTR